MALRLAYKLSFVPHDFHSPLQEFPVLRRKLRGPPATFSQISLAKRDNWGTFQHLLGEKTEGGVMVSTEY